MYCNGAYLLMHTVYFGILPGPNLRPLLFLILMNDLIIRTPGLIRYACWSRIKVKLSPRHGCRIRVTLDRPSALDMSDLLDAKLASCTSSIHTLRMLLLLLLLLFFILL